MRMRIQPLALTSEWVKDPDLLDLGSLWLWCRPAGAFLIGPLASWDIPYAAGAALKKKKKELSLEKRETEIGTRYRKRTEGCEVKWATAPAPANLNFIMYKMR